MYDLIGDIHGHADELIKLLHHLGYKQSATGFYRSDRKVIFLGDFIDRGEHLRQHQLLLNTVMAMVDNGHALAVMGNHELNALAFHTEHEGRPLRAHTEKNIHQHRAFLNEYNDEPELKAEVLAFFYRLPLWLELDGLNVVHACWHDAHISMLKDHALDGMLNKSLLVKATTKGSKLYDAIETLLKGVEVSLGEGITFKDKDDHERNAVRVQWWNHSATTLGEMALPKGVNIGDASALPIPVTLPQYDQDKQPCFIGHYWLSGVPNPLTDNVACLDYSVTQSDGKLVAYRWDGEQTLSAEKFTHA